MPMIYPIQLLHFIVSAYGINILHMDINMNNIFVVQNHSLELVKLAVGNFGCAQRGEERVSNYTRYSETLNRVLGGGLQTIFPIFTYTLTTQGRERTETGTGGVVEGVYNGRTHQLVIETMLNVGGSQKVGLESFESLIPSYKLKRIMSSRFAWPCAVQ